jgi:hypothetical protein
MASQQFYGLEGKLRRTCYAIVFQDMVSNITTLKREDIKKILKGIESGINDAVENSLEYMVEHEIIEVQSKTRKKRKKR